MAKEEEFKVIHQSNFRYLIFAGSSYYPFGGARDLVGIEVHSDEAVRFARGLIGQVLKSVVDEGLVDEDDRFSEQKVDWSHIYDRVERKLVAEYGSGSSSSIVSSG